MLASPDRGHRSGRAARANRAAALLLAAWLTGAAFAQHTRPPNYDLRSHGGAVQAIAWGPDGEQIAGAYADNRIRVWNVKPQRVAQEFAVRAASVDRSFSSTTSGGRIEALAWSAAGGWLVDGYVPAGSTGAIRLWDPSNGTRIRTLAEELGSLRALDVSPDGRVIALNSPDRERSGHRITLMQVENAETVAEIRGDRLAVSSLRFSRDGERIVSFGGTRVALWNVAERSLIREWATPGKTILAAALSADGKLLAAGGADEKLRIWNTEDGKIVHEIPHKSTQVQALAFSHTGRTLASGGSDNSIRLWSVEFGHQRELLLFHRDRVNCLEFSPDGKLLAAGSRDESIGIWSIQEPEVETPPKEEPTKEEPPKPGTRRR